MLGEAQVDSCPGRVTVDWQHPRRDSGWCRETVTVAAVSQHGGNSRGTAVKHCTGARVVRGAGAGARINTDAGICWPRILRGGTRPPAPSASGGAGCICVQSDALASDRRPRSPRSPVSVLEVATACRARGRPRVLPRGRGQSSVQRAFFLRANWAGGAWHRSRHVFRAAFSLPPLPCAGALRERIPTAVGPPRNEHSVPLMLNNTTLSADRPHGRLQECENAQRGKIGARRRIFRAPFLETCRQHRP